ncbi:unknown [Neodiprion lecontei nucleopolyhedrovirus]|uniref:Uncharacterized protein n=1 Tax=Neodiprion lecontei nucleopolyhedrovirus (strain Canada) TaxID=654906 RepID=Q6JPD9_NPVNC|nr:unknown [Neodiprion lecontei nucleopolyhedrovirus]AAQ99079.1 unknown [Neodiprion lecontei nucleopolyhedrovirus]
MSKREVYLLIEQTKKELGDESMRAKFWSAALEYFSNDTRVWLRQEITDAITLASNAARIKNEIQLTTIQAAEAANRNTSDDSSSEDEIQIRAKNILTKKKDKINRNVLKSTNSTFVDLQKKPYSRNTIITTLTALKDVDSTPQKFTVGDFVEGLLYIMTPNLVPNIRTWLMTIIDSSKQNCILSNDKEEIYNNVLKDIRLLLSNDKYYSFNIESILLIQKKMQTIFRMPLPQLPRLYQIKTDVLFSDADKRQNLQILITRRLKQMATSDVSSFLPQIEIDTNELVEQKHLLSKSVNIGRVNYTVLNQLYSNQYTTSLLTNTPTLHDEWQQLWLLSTDNKQQRIVRRKLVNDADEPKKAKLITEANQ